MVKKKLKRKRLPYSKLRDDEKVSRNWNKARRLFDRGEFSVAIIRCGTCVELVVNFAVRQELVDECRLPLPFVNKLLKNSNGLRNKYLNLLVPLWEEYEEQNGLKKLWKQKVEEVNKQRNAIAHSGEFRSRKTACKIMKDTYETLQEIMGLYEHKAELIEFEA